MRETAISTNKHVYSLLTSDSELTEMVNDNIFPLVAEESVNYPFIIFTKESVTPSYTKDFLTFDLVTISVVVASNNYIDTVNIAERVRNVLENYRDSYFYNILLDSVSEEFVEDAFIQQLNFSAKINVNN